MPIDQAPAPPAHYKVAPVRAEGASDVASVVARHLAARRQMASSAVDVLSDGMTVAKLLPPLELSSPAFTRADRESLLMASEANRLGRLSSTAIPITGSYPSERIGAASAQSLMSERIVSGVPVSGVEALNYRCRLVGIVLDRRAGEYVVGGEKAAAAARARLPAAAIAECAPTVSGQAAKVVAAKVVAPKPPQRLDLVGSKPAQRLDLVGSKGPQRLDLVGSKPAQRIDLGRLSKGPVRVDLTSASQARSKGGSGM